MANVVDGSTAARRVRDQDARQPTLKSGFWTAAIRLLTVTAISGPSRRTRKFLPSAPEKGRIPAASSNLSSAQPGHKRSLVGDRFRTDQPATLRPSTLVARVTGANATSPSVMNAGTSMVGIELSGRIWASNSAAMRPMRPCRHPQCLVASDRDGPSTGRRWFYEVDTVSRHLVN